MKRMILSLALLSFSPYLFANTPDAFQNNSSCFILYNVNTKQIIQEYNPEACKQRISPDSTFKVPLSLMAFDDNIITQQTVFKWDGKQRALPQWNHDQTPQSWLKNSVVWVSQSLTPQIGLRKIKTYLHEFHYGNQDFSGDPYQNNGLTHAWLESSLKISADEQLDFLKHLVANTLPVSPDALKNTQQNMYLETLPHGYKLFGKTGSGQNGWFIGYLTNPTQTYIVVTHIPIAQGDGATAKKLTKAVLTQMGIF